MVELLVGVGFRGWRVIGEREERQLFVLPRSRTSSMQYSRNR